MPYWLMCIIKKTCYVIIHRVVSSLFLLTFIWPIPADFCTQHNKLWMIGSYIDPHPFTDQGEILHARLHLSTLPFKSHLVGCILSLCLAWKKYANMTEFWILEAHIPSPFTIQREILIKILNMASSIQGAPKNVGTVFCMPLLTAFRNCFSVRIRRKFAIIPLLMIQPHLKCGRPTTLSREMSLNRANCRRVLLITP